MEPVLAKGSQRRNAVVIGKHGLVIAKGGCQGLLLPGVAVEHHLDAEGFLEQVCRKAGLPANAWRDQDAELMTFQGHAIEGELRTVVPDSPLLPVASDRTGEGQGVRALKSLSTAAILPPGPSRADVTTLADFCRQNLAALMIGATPACYLPGAFDGTVHAVVLSLQLPGSAERIDSSQVNILAGMPLQSTLFALTKSAAAVLQQRGVGPAAISGAAIDVTILWDAAMHGSAEAPQLQGVDPRQRSLFVIRRLAGRGLGPRRSGPTIFSAAVVNRLHAPTALRASVFSLAVISTLDRIMVDDTPNRQTGAGDSLAGVCRHVLSSRCGGDRPPT